MAAAAPTQLAAAFGALPQTGETPSTAPPALAPNLSFLGPETEPLPQGLAADPTYLAFLRGMGMDETSAWQTAVQHVAQVRSAYQIGVSREPQQLQSALGAVNARFGGEGDVFSGARLADEARAHTESQQRLQDLSIAQAQGLSNVHSTLQNQLSTLAQNNVDQIAALQARRDAQANTDAYTRAVFNAEQQRAAAAAPAVDPLATYFAALGGPTGAQPAAPAAQPAQPGTLQARLAAMTPEQQAAFRAYTAAATARQAAQTQNVVRAQPF